MGFLRVHRLKWMGLFPLVLALVLVTACGGDDAEPVATSKPQPTATSAPTSQPTATSAPEPTDAPQATNTPRPTSKPNPTATSEPEKPTVAPPTAAPPTATPAPTAVPEKDTGPVATQAPIYHGVQGGVYPIINSGFPARWDPHLAGTLPEIGAISPLYNQVVEYNPTNPSEIIGDLAESWELASDNLSYTFTIRTGVKWSDGQDLTAEDVAFSINRMIQEGEPRPRAGLMRTSTASAEVVGTSGVKVNLNFPDASFLPFLAVDFMKVVPKHVLDAGSDINVWDNIIGSGPYIPEKVSRGSFSQHMRNPNYFKEGRPYFDQLVVHVIGDPGTASAAFETGRLLGSTAGLSIGVDGVFELSDKLVGKYTLYFTPVNSGTHIFANFEKAPWNDLRVLSALKLATDQQEINDAFNVRGTHTYGAPFPVGGWYGSTVEELGERPGFGGIEGSSRTKADDIAAAKALLADAGFDPPSSLGKPVLTLTNIIWFPDVAQLWKEQMRRNLGLEIEIRTVDFSTGFGDLQSGNYELGVFAYAWNISDPNDYVKAIYGPIARNYTRWTDPDFQALFDEQAAEPDRAKRVPILRQMEEMLLERSPYVEIFWVNNRYFISDRIRTQVGSFVPPESIQTVLKQEHLWLAP